MSIRIICLYPNQRLVLKCGGIKRKFKAIPDKDCVQTRSQLFRKIVQNDAGIPAYFKEFWAKMTEKMQAYARCCLNIIVIKSQLKQTAGIASQFRQQLYFKHYAPYLTVLTLTPGPIVDETVQDLI